MPSIRHKRFDEAKQIIVKYIELYYNSMRLHSRIGCQCPNDVYYIEHDSDNCENYALLFAYIALLDKNNFYKNESAQYVLKTDFELFNEYMKLVHISRSK